MPREKISRRFCSWLLYRDLWSCFLLFVFLSVNISVAEAEKIFLPSEIVNQYPPVLECPAHDPSLYYSPVIGVLSHPGDGAGGMVTNAKSASYIASSYVKFVESAGARVIPIIYNEPMEVILEKLELVNGLVLTGGSCKSGLYYKVVEQIFKRTLAKNDAGDHFPLIAICLGFELLMMIISKDKNILEKFDATNQASSLKFMHNISFEGTIFQRFPPELLRKLSEECLVMQNHLYGVSPEQLVRHPFLSSFFKILTTSIDRRSEVYVSTVQAQNYPVIGLQWHPEKNAFEWGLPVIPHNEDAVQVTQLVANFIISEARKSSNRPSSHKLLDDLIYNHSPVFCGRLGSEYEEVYVFS